MSKGIRTIDGFAVVSRHFLRRRAEEHAQELRRQQDLAQTTSGPTNSRARERLSLAGIVFDDRLVVYKPHRWARRFYVVIDNNRRLAA